MIKKYIAIFYTILLCIYGKTQTEYEIPSDVDIDNKPSSIGYLLTDRNFPDMALDSFEIISCRKTGSIPHCFYRNYSTWNYKIDPLSKKINDLNIDDKNNLCQLAWNTRDEKYFNLLLKLVNIDTLRMNREIRLQMLMNLSAFNTEISKIELEKFLNCRDLEMATIAAIILIQFGDFNLSLKYLQFKYNNEHFAAQVYTSLMRINTVQSIDLLKKLAKEQKDPSLSIDALAALSLLGNCNYAFNEITPYLKNTNENVRRMSVSCLAYYIGTDEAFKFIKAMQNDKSKIVQNEVYKVLRNFYKSKSKK